MVQISCCYSWLRYLAGSLSMAWISCSYHISLNSVRGMMGKLFEGFKLSCTDFDHILEKKGGNYSRGDIVQWRILIEEIRYVLPTIH